MKSSRGLEGEVNLHTLFGRDRHMKSTCYWRDRWGRVWLVKEMSTDHLKNTLKFMRDNAYQLRMLDDKGNSPILLFNRQWLKRTPIYKSIKEEYESRKK